MFSIRTFWRVSAQPHWLVDVCLMSGRNNCFGDVWRELDLFKAGPTGDNYLALYSYAVMELLLPSGWEIDKSIQGLLSKPKIKDGCAMGHALESIVKNDQTNFTTSMLSLLKAHEGMAKHGGLRETAEGFLCMPAMSLAYVASKRNLKVEFENDYLSIGYLEFLLNSDKV